MNPVAVTRGIQVCAMYDCISHWLPQASQYGLKQPCAYKRFQKCYSISIVMALVQPLPHEINSPSASESSADNAKQLVLLEKPGKELERLHQLPPPRREIYLISAKIVLVLIFIISYHTFCIIVHYRQVPIGRSATLGLPFLHSKQYHSKATSSSLTARRSLPVDTVSVITTVAILIVYVTLWPMKDVIDEIRVCLIIYYLSTLPLIRGLSF